MAEDKKKEIDVAVIEVTEEYRFIPVNEFALCGKWVHFITAARNCQEDWLIGRMKQIHKSVGRICRNLGERPFYCNDAGNMLE